jgi:Phosphopantetheine attachment site
VLSSVPRTRSGKVDRRSLPTPVLDRNAYAGPRVAPRTGAEREVAAIVTSILERQVGMLDDFFELGGRSLQAARLSAQVGTALGVELPLFAIYRDPTIAGIARFVASSAGWPDGA